MSKALNFGRLILGLAAALCAVPAPRAAGDEAAVSLPESFTAFAVNTSNLASRARSGTVDIVIERWSTDEERASLAATLVEKGADGLLGALQKIKPRAGFIRMGTGRGYDLQYARQFVNDDGSRRIVIATDREISFYEARNQPRTVDYPFLLVEMRLDAKGNGQGKLAPLVKVTFDEATKTLELENYASEPVRLTQIRKNK